MYTCQQLNLKNKLSKQAEQEQNHRYGDHRVISWEGEGGSEGKCAGIKKYKLVGTE